MSIVKGASRRRRAPQTARSEAIAAARAILLADGPASVTLTAVAKAVGVTHANLLHHFGSAGALQAALMESMVADLCTGLEAAIVAVVGGKAPPGTPTDIVFAAFAEGGAAKLMAWLVLSGETKHLEPIQQRIAALVTAFSAPLPGERRPVAKVRSAVLLSAYLAFADALIGPILRKMLKLPDDAALELTKDNVLRIVGVH